MRLLPPSLWLLVAAQIDAQAQLPTAVRKMSPDAGEKFHHEYCAFEEQAQGAAWSTATTAEARAAIAARQPFAERDAPLLAANASAQLLYRPPFAPHAEWLSQGDGRSDADARSFGWLLLKRAAAGALARLEGRQWSCPGGTSSCADIGFPNSCCHTGETCVKIKDTGLGPVGCCPSGSTCGGTISNCASGNTACASEIGGGCCIPGFVCRGVGCVPSAPALTTITTTSTSVISAATPSTIIVTVTITQSQSDQSPQTSTTTRTVSPTKPPTSTTSDNDVSAPVRPTSSASNSPTGTDSNTYCPTGFYACLASAGGGCCQTGRDCKTTSCPPVRSTTIVDGNGITVVVPATAVPTAGAAATCASGWYMCDADVGPRPGCCPSSYDCGTASCLLVQSGATASVAKGLPGSGAARLGRGGEVFGLLVGMVMMTFVIFA